MNYIYSINKTAPWNRLGVMLALVALFMTTVPVRAIADTELMPELLPATDAPAVEQVAEAAPAATPVVPAARFTSPHMDDAVRTAATGYKVVRVYNDIPSTAYTSRPEETDDTPFIAADGTHVFDGMVAANFLPFGTKIRIPSLYGDKVFTVHDRMNKRYHYKVDLWMEHLQDARNHGLRVIDIEIIEPIDEPTA